MRVVRSPLDAVAPARGGHAWPDRRCGRGKSGVQKRSDPLGEDREGGTRATPARQQRRRRRARRLVRRQQPAEAPPPRGECRWDVAVPGAPEPGLRSALRGRDADAACRPPLRCRPPAGRRGRRRNRTRALALARDRRPDGRRPTGDDHRYRGWRPGRLSRRDVHESRGHTANRLSSSGCLDRPTPAVAGTGRPRSCAAGTLELEAVLLRELGCRSSADQRRPHGELRSP
jgi:hypothetical protein